MGEVLQVGIDLGTSRSAISASNGERVCAPSNHDHHHDRGDVHDAERLLTGLGDALDVLPPEVHRDEDREEGRRRIHGKDDGGVRVAEQFVQQTGQIETRRYAADRTCQDVVENER